MGAGPVRLVVATANPDKAAEIEAILSESLGRAVELLPRPPEVPEVQETGASLDENALLKSSALTLATGTAAIADDTGLEVRFLGGAPGVLSARYAGEEATYADNVAKLLAAMGGAGDRRARFRTVVSVSYPDGTHLSAEGAVDGTIAVQARGDGGFGYDPVFVPDGGLGRTFAEMAPAAKHAISHRARALRALAPLLLDPR